MIYNTLMSILGGCHCARSPPGPKIECLERVSSVGRIKLTDLENRASNKQSMRQDQETSVRNIA